MTKVKIDYDHVWHHHPLTVKFFINNLEIQQETELDLSEGEHEYKIVVSGKTFDNVLQEDGDTIEDTYIKLKSVLIDDNEVLGLLNEEAKFYPDHPNPKAPILEKITELGYNGEYRFKFSVPTWEWLIEKLY
tara:strand:+ start:3502 stop:3897 length:396 start_codon:yes stop_codon:yes gene_type:complete